MKRRHLVIFIVTGILYCLVFQVFYNLLRYDKVLPYDNFFDALQSTVYNLIPILIILLLNYIIIFKLNQKIKDNNIVKVSLDFILSFVILSIINVLFLLIMRLFDPDISVDWVGTVLNNILIFMGLEIIYYIRVSHDSLKKAEEERRLALQYQYNMLKAQINPHFLFNSLNILY